MTTDRPTHAPASLVTYCNLSPPVVRNLIGSNKYKVDARRLSGHGIIIGGELKEQQHRVSTVRLWGDLSRGHSQTVCMLC